MTLTRARTIQYIGIVLSLGLIAVGYWYFSVRAGVKTNTSALQSQGVGDLSAGLTGYWKFDDASGTTATDASTNGNNGTLTNGPTWSTGQIGGAATFDGTNDYVDAGTPTALDIGSDPHTISAWVKTSVSNTDQTIFSSGAASCCGVETAIAFNYNVGGGFYEFAYSNSGAGILNSNITGDIQTNTWYHVVGTWDGSTRRIYVNGVLSASDSVTSLSSEFNNIVHIGAGATTDGPSFAQYLNGSIDEVRAYNRALSTDEVSNLYRLTAPTGVDTSLKGYWSFNAGALSSTTAYDWSGAGNNGTVTNSPAVTEGRVGQALNFWPGGSDTDARVNVGNVSSLDVSTGDFTLNFWTKNTGYVAQGSGINTFAGKQGISACEAGYHIDYASANLPRLYIADSGCAHDAVVIHNVNIADNQWHMVTGTKSGTNINIAVDGVFTTAVSAATVGSLTNSKPFVIGDDGFTDGARNIQGLIDEVRFYNRAFSEVEVKSLYDRGAPDKGNTSALQPGGNGRLESGLAAYWKLDETTGSSAADASTNGNTGTLSNMENGDWVTGQIGNGLDFDGTNEYVGASATPFTGHSSGTITAWIKSTNASAAQTIFGISTLASSNYGAYFHTNANGKLQMRIKGNGVDLVNCGVTDSGASAQVAASGTWTFVAITNDAAGKKIYKNAYQQNSDCGSDATWFDDLSAQTPVDASIGSWLVNGAAGTLFQGSIDEVRVYDHALSLDEIANLYRVTTPTAVDANLKGYWSFNGQDMSGTSAYDRSGAGNTGTITGGPAVAEGIAGQALSFDGTNDVITTSCPSTLSNATVSFWAKTNGSGGAGNKHPFDIRDNVGGSAVIAFRSGAADDIFIRNDVGTTAQITTMDYSVDNTWHHYVATIDGANLIGYKDGVSVGSVAWSSSLTGIDNCYIGDSNGTDAFAGSVDEVRVYNRVLSAGEIQALYAVGTNDKTNASITQPQGTGRLDSGLAGYWKLDENTGTSTADASTNGSTGTLTNGPTWMTGRIGSAVDFDGANDTLNVGSNSALNLTQNSLTIAAWIYPQGITTTPSYHQAIFDRWDHACTGLGYSFNISNYYLVGNPTQLVFNSDCGGNQQSVDTGLVNNSWQHVAVSVTSGSIAFYVNGKRIQTSAGGTISMPLSYSGPAYIGNGPSGAYPFDGGIDEVRVYNRGLSADEISQLYRLTSPTGTDTSLINYWSFNGQDMNATTVFDRSGRGVNGTLTNGPAATEGKIGQGLSFDGTNDYVDAGSYSAEQTVYTVALWVYQNGSATGVPFLRGNSGGCFYNPRIYVDSTTVTYAESGCSGTGIVGSAPFPAGWHHVVATRNGGTSRLYLDGELIPTTGASAGALGESNAKIVIGAGWEFGIGHSTYFNSKLDEIRVYNRELSASEIKSLYNLSR